jgi:hypothetical protein
MFLVILQVFMISSWINFTLSASEVIPLDQKQWRTLTFNNIDPNKVEFRDGAIFINVNNSASPLIFPFTSPRNIKSFKVQGQVTGTIQSPNENFAEDSYMRFGLILTGSKKLNRLQRLFAASWVKLLFEMAPKDRGLDKISFFNLTDQAHRLNQFRVYPSSDLLEELVHTLLNEDGHFTMIHQFEEALEVAGIWISSDGDHTNAVFATRIDLIEIQ